MDQYDRKYRLYSAGNLNQINMQWIWSSTWKAQWHIFMWNVIDYPLVRDNKEIENIVSLT